MNWDSGFENFKNYLKLERGLSDNSIKSYDYDLILFKKFLIANKINDTPLNCKPETIKNYLYKSFSNKKSISQARSISAIKSFFNYLIFWLTIHQFGYFLAEVLICPSSYSLIPPLLCCLAFNLFTYFFNITFFYHISILIYLLISYFFNTTWIINKWYSNEY